MSDIGEWHEERGYPIADGGSLHLGNNDCTISAVIIPKGDAFYWYVEQNEWDDSGAVGRLRKLAEGGSDAATIDEAKAAVAQWLVAH